VERRYISSRDFLNCKAMSEAPAAKNMEKTSSELPPDLFMEILSWIPARALLKLWCVRKHWYYMTTDLVFIRLHLQRQQLLPKVTSVLKFHKHLINDRALLSLLDVVNVPMARTYGPSLQLLNQRYTWAWFDSSELKFIESSQAARLQATPNAATPLPPERPCKPVISAAFRFPQSAGVITVSINIHPSPFVEERERSQPEGQVIHGVVGCERMKLQEIAYASFNGFQISGLRVIRQK
ncbi:F-box associated domain, partial [Musa troglodytarum]